MSHCLIVQLSKEPIDKEDFITPDTFDEDPDIEYVSDYVCERDNYEDDVKWFLEQLGDSVTYDKSDNSITFVNKEEYFKEDFEEFSKLVQNCTLKDFCDHDWMFQVQSYVRPWFDTYIYTYYSQPMGEFVRDYGNAGEKFYIGGICDYHC